VNIPRNPAIIPVVPKGGDVTDLNDVGNGDGPPEEPDAVPMEIDGVLDLHTVSYTHLTLPTILRV